MKVVNKLWITAMIALAMIACSEDEGPVPTIDFSNGVFVAPEFSSASFSAFDTLNLDNPNDTLEVLTWERFVTDGIQIATTYTIEIATDTDFSTAATLGSANETSLAVTVGDFSDAFLEAGALSGELDTVYYRIMAAVQTDSIPTMTSTTTISRSAISKAVSACGNFCTMAIIGSATPGGWDFDTDMYISNPSDLSTWTIVINSPGGVFKFRTNDNWDVNWGSTGTPGLAQLGGFGNDIPIDNPGWYRITFNDNTLDYAIEPITATTYTSIGIIGSGTPGGWDSDTDLTETAAGSHIWQGAVTLTAAEAKFRANDAWDVNWGADGDNVFPVGEGIAGGPNIPVSAGDFTVRFNDVSAQYWFLVDGTEYGSVGVVGEFSGWGGDPDFVLTRAVDNPYYFSGVLTLLAPSELKFRANSDWGTNWGGDGTSGISAFNGANIQLDAGTYFVVINTGTREYAFLK